MARVVISFLGLVSDQVAYEFPSERKPKERFFLPALLKELRDLNRAADRVSVIGVRTSSWSDLLNDLPNQQAIDRRELRDFEVFAKSDAADGVTDNAIGQRWTELASRTGPKLDAVILPDLAGGSEPVRKVAERC